MSEATMSEAALGASPVLQLKATVDSDQSEIEQLKAKVDALKATVVGLKCTVDELKATVAVRDATVVELKSQVEQHDRHANEISAATGMLVGKLQDPANEHSTDWMDTNGRLLALDQQGEAFENQLFSLNVTSAEHVALEKRVKTLETNLKPLGVELLEQPVNNQETQTERVTIVTPKSMPSGTPASAPKVVPPPYRAPPATDPYNYNPQPVWPPLPPTPPPRARTPQPPPAPTRVNTPPRRMGGRTNDSAMETDE